MCSRVSGMTISQSFCCMPCYSFHLFHISLLSRCCRIMLKKGCTLASTRFPAAPLPPWFSLRWSWILSCHLVVWLGFYLPLSFPCARRSYNSQPPSNHPGVPWHSNLLLHGLWLQHRAVPIPLVSQRSSVESSVAPRA